MDDDRESDEHAASAASPGADASPVATDAEDSGLRAADRRWLRLVGLAAVVALAAALAVGLYVLVSGEDEPARAGTITVPDVVGTPEAQAVDKLRSQEIQYETHRGPSNEQPNGYVYKQDPEGGTPMSPGTDMLRLYISTGPRAKPTTEVPDVRGHQRDEAVAALAAAKLKPTVHEVPSGQPPNTVTAQDPKPGDLVPEGTTVRINVSASGPSTVRVPDVRGLSRTIAVATLTGAGLTPKVHQVYSNELRDTAIDQDPQPGEMVDEGTLVRIDVSAGQKPNGEQVDVPSVVGRPYDSALAQLQSVGLAVARHDADSNEPAGIVIEQSPAGGETASLGSTVTLQVSKGPQQTTLPDVTNQDVDSATAALKDAGFKVEVVHEDTTDPLEDNVVLSQTPEAGTEAKPGSSVTIVVGRFAEPTGTTTAAGVYLQGHAAKRQLVQRS